MSARNPCPAHVARMAELRSAPVEYGPARYVIIYEGGVPGAPRTLRHTMEVLRQFGREDGAVRVEPVAGTQAQITRSVRSGGGITFPWYNVDDAAHVQRYASGRLGNRPVSVCRALRLRSPRP